MISLDGISVDLRSKTNVKTVSAGAIYIQNGDAGALLGPNGTGKTTILRVAAGSITAKTGTVNIDRPLIAFTDIEKQVHYRLTLVENHSFFCALYGLTTISHQQILDSLELAGLGTMSQGRAGALSKGEKARLVFSIIDAHKCASFIVDEPTNGLDDDGKEYVCGVITRKLSVGGSCLVSTHDQVLVERLGAAQFKADSDGRFYRI